jgi:hypothetical protein
MMKREAQKTLWQKSNIYKHFFISHRYLLTHLLTSSSSSGPGAYAPDELQPVGLSCDPYAPVILDVPTFTARFPHVHMTREILAAKGGTVGENVGW